MGGQNLLLTDPYYSIIRAMDKRLFLNIVIVAILSFYLIFGIAYRGLLEESEPDLAEDSNWEQPYLIPKGWTLTEIEFAPQIRLTPTAEGWQAGELISTEVAGLVVNNWQGLVIQDIASYDELPVGTTVLAFVEQRTAPIAYRLIEQSGSIQIYRLEDKKLFTLPQDLKPVIWIN